MWECGLKPAWLYNAINATMSLLMWECGLKHIKVSDEYKVVEVTPYVGVWIET